jgi:hypothetical protein
MRDRWSEAMKSITDLKRDTLRVVRTERELRLDRKAKDERNGGVLDAFDRMAAAPDCDCWSPNDHRPFCPSRDRR